MKPDQERVKNLLLDTVTLLCKNSLQYDNKLRVEGLLGVAVDEKEVFFLHISENFKSAAYLDKLEAEATAAAAAAEAAKVPQKGECANDEERCSPTPSGTNEERQEQYDSQGDSPTNSKAGKLHKDSMTIKTETVESLSEDEDVMITGSSGLNSPETVAQPAIMVAGKRRAERRPRSPLKGCNSSLDHCQTSEVGESDYANNSYSQHEQGALSRGPAFEHYKYDAGDSFKQESDWGEPPAKRHTNSGTTHPWPNVAGFGDLAAQAVQASFQESEDSQVSPGGDISQPGCSTWSSQLPPSSLGATNSSGQETKALELQNVEVYRSSTRGSSLHAYSGSLGELKENGSPMAQDEVANSVVSIQGQQVFCCSYCGRTFRLTGDLRRHLLTHTGEKPHRCGVCGQHFARLDSCKRHMKVHNKVS